jgi:hypothetical protein
MDLYCWPHNKTHPFTPGEVEQIVYALTAMEFEAKRSPEGNWEEYSPKQLCCPREALSLAQDSECYLEQVQQGVECRRAA